MSIERRPFGVDTIGRMTTLFTLKNARGASVSVLDYGAHIVSVKMPDKFGTIGEVSLGFDELASYEKAHACMGATIGRYANRIGKARFELDGKAYTLFPNEHGNCLHGGRENFQFKWFSAEALESEHEDALFLTYVAHDGEEGFPGKMRVQVTFALDEDNRLTLRYLASSDKDTVVNLTNHVYFNLAGGGDILSHRLQVHAAYITETDDERIPTGVLLPVENTPFDLRNGIVIGEGVAQKASNQTLKNANGYDVNFCVGEEGTREAAVLSDDASGRVLRVITDQPGVQLYTGQGLHFIGHGGQTYGAYAGLALETQHYADSPNHPNFPSTLLKAGEVFTSETTYAFEIAKE